MGTLTIKHNHYSNNDDQTLDLQFRDILSCDETQRIQIGDKVKSSFCLKT